MREGGCLRVRSWLPPLHAEPTRKGHALLMGHLLLWWPKQDQTIGPTLYFSRCEKCSPPASEDVIDAPSGYIIF